MTTAVLDLPRATPALPETTFDLKTLRERTRITLGTLLTHQPEAQISALPRLSCCTAVDRLPMPAMSRATVDGSRIPILAGMEMHIAVRSLKALLDLGQIAGLMLTTAPGKGRMLRDDETVNLNDDLKLRVIRLNLAS